MLENIAEGLPMAERTLALAVQGQSYGPMFDEKVTVAAWKSKPNWAVISTKDRMLQPAMEEAMAKRMKARTTVVETFHMVILEDPEDVVRVLDEAAQQALTLSTRQAHRSADRHHRITFRSGCCSSGHEVSSARTGCYEAHTGPSRWRPTAPAMNAAFCS